MILAGYGEEVLELSLESCRPLPLLHSDHEEADTRLLLHTHEAFSKYFQVVVIEVEDTDVFILALHHYDCTWSKFAQPPQ